MHLREIRLGNIKCFADVELSFVGNDGAVRRWTTILGPNGCGKTTLLQAMATALAGPDVVRDFGALFDSWRRDPNATAHIAATLLIAERDLQYAMERAVASADSNMPWQCRLELPPDQPSFVPVGSTWPTFALPNTVWANRRPGFFASGYGPYRRLSGSSQFFVDLARSGGRAARLMTLFREEAAVVELEAWLLQLHNLARESTAGSQRLLDRLATLLAEHLFPEPLTLVLSAKEALFSVNGRKPVGLHQLSDGYRSMLSLGLDLYRRLSEAFPASDAPHEEPGVVLIDELDAHMHPLWQQRIGQWLLDKFPNLQFIVATHSPFLAQVAEEAGGNIVLEQKPDGTVTARSEPLAVHTWRTDQILTELFGLTSTMAPEVRAKLERYLWLEGKRRTRALTEAEAREYGELETFYRSIPPPIEDPAGRRRAQALDKLLDAHADKLRELK